jgi:hypothetical protein
MGHGSLAPACVRGLISSANGREIGFSGRQGGLPQHITEPKSKTEPKKPNRNRILVFMVRFQLAKVLTIYTYVNLVKNQKNHRLAKKTRITQHNNEF